ncbi:hypothetical protein [Acinetobacter sp.]|uniref:hypothetical protein n=1 Tax=Acinetobacter sp. TaxID=472 RepID=UPI0028A7B463|nr:hypothetical protein [Acinetobacter sp.]
MKPCNLAPLKNSIKLTETSDGPPSTVGKIAGVVKLMGVKYPYCLIVLYLKNSLTPYMATKSNDQGGYVFRGVPADMPFFIVAFDKKQQFNAVIQDNVVPK